MAAILKIMSLSPRHVAPLGNVVDLTGDIFGRTMYPRSFAVIALILSVLRRLALCAVTPSPQA